MFSFYKVILDLLKARTHKYVRRVPIGATHTGATKYKYYYQEQAGHGKGLGHESELVKDASFAFGEGENKYHAHIKSIDGDNLTIEYDDGAKKGQRETLSKTEFQNRIHKEHATSIERSHERAKKQLATFQQMKEKGHKVKDSTLDKLKAQVNKLDSLKKKPEAPQAPKPTGIFEGKSKEEIVSLVKKQIDRDIQQSSGYIDSLLMRLKKIYTFGEQNGFPFDDIFNVDTLELSDKQMQSIFPFYNDAKYYENRHIKEVANHPLSNILFDNHYKYENLVSIVTAKARQSKEIPVIWDSIFKRIRENTADNETIEKEIKDFSSQKVDTIFEDILNNPQISLSKNAFKMKNNDKLLSNIFDTLSEQSSMYSKGDREPTAEYLARTHIFYNDGSFYTLTNKGYMEQKVPSNIKIDPDTKPFQLSSENLSKILSQDKVTIKQNGNKLDVSNDQGVSILPEHIASNALKTEDSAFKLKRVKELHNTVSKEQPFKIPSDLKTNILKIQTKTHPFAVLKIENDTISVDLSPNIKQSDSKDPKNYIYSLGKIPVSNKDGLSFSRFISTEALQGILSTGGDTIRIASEPKLKMSFFGVDGGQGSQVIV